MGKIVYQAEVSKAEAEANIIRKLNVLKSWLANGIPYHQTNDGNTLLNAQNHKLLDFYPKSLRQFKLWNGTQNCCRVRDLLPEIATTGNDTLSKRPELEQQVGKVVEALKLRAQIQENSTKHVEIDRLEAELRIASDTIRLRNSELREQQRKILALQRTLSAVQVKAKNDEKEYKKDNEELLQEVETLKRLNANLTAQLSKVFPLRKT